MRIDAVSELFNQQYYADRLADIIHDFDDCQLSGLQFAEYVRALLERIREDALEDMKTPEGMDARKAALEDAILEGA